MICIATPARDTVNATFAYDLVELTKYSPDMIFAIALGTYIPNNRIGLVRQAMEAGVSHILFIDSDMRFPAGTLQRLLGHRKDIVGANCHQRTQDQWTARKADQFVSSDEKVGLEEVDTLGFGVTLIDMKVFQETPEPWFAMPYDGDKLVGEDVFFCMKAREKFDIWIDHDLSQEIKHTGSKEY